MSIQGWGEIALTLGLACLLGWPIGVYMSRVWNGERTWLDPVLKPVEGVFYRLGGVEGRLRLRSITPPPRRFRSYYAGQCALPHPRSGRRPDPQGLAFFALGLGAGGTRRPAGCAVRRAGRARPSRAATPLQASRFTASPATTSAQARPQKSPAFGSRGFGTGSPMALAHVEAAAGGLQARC